MLSNDEVTSQRQDAAAKLREQFLKGIIELTGQECKILTFEKTQLEATFFGWNPDGTEILVKDLKTPAFTNMSSALLRTPDIIAVKFDKHVPLP